MMIKIYILIFVIGMVGSIAYGGYYYYKDTQEQIKVLTANTAKLEAAKKIQDNTIETLKKDAEKYRKLNKELNTNLQNAEKYKNTLIGKLRKHNLSRLSQQKPKLVEQKINRGTQKLFNSFKRITTVPATQ
jgi:predicted ribosome quality control (RQC) complex YloA/Tae2 family protein